MLLALTAFAVVVYERITPDGMFADLQNDLRAIDPAFDASYTTLDGIEVDIREYRGEPLIINSWATWMPFSANELQLLNDWASQYAGSVQVLAINRMEESSTVRAFLGGLPPLDNIVVLLDPGDTFYKAVSGYAMPETVLYARDGSIIDHVRGVMSEDMIRTLFTVAASEDQ
jgi:thiol-disulfide isomerase/thioredoxin